MNAYIVRRMATFDEDLNLDQSVVKDLDIDWIGFDQPDFSYRHEQAKPVLSISIGNYSRQANRVNILVHYPDRLVVINKKTNTDFANE